jgi:mannosyltransferase
VTAGRRLDPAEPLHPALDSKTTTLILAAVVGLAAWLRLSNLTAQSLWWDEVVSWQQSRLDLAGLIAATARDNYPPLQNILIHISMLAFGETEFGLRLPSALLGIANVLGIYWLGTMLGGRRAGLIAAGLLALSGYHIWYSQEARMYALLALSATLFAGCAIRFSARPGWLWGTLSIIAATALLYSHPYGALTWAAIGAGVVLPAIVRGRWRLALGFGALQLLPLLGFVPWALVLLNRAAIIDAQGFWIPDVTPWSVLQHFVALLSGPFLFAAFGVGIRLAVKPPVPDTLWLLGAWIVLPLLAGIALSLLIEPMLVSRYLIGTLPAMLVVIAIGLAQADRLMLGGLAAAALTGLFFAPEPRDDLRSVAAVLTAELGPADCLMTTVDGANGLTYYHREPIACVLPTWTFKDLAIPQGTDRVFVMTGADLDPEAIGLTKLGDIVGTRTFGITALHTLDPK